MHGGVKPTDFFGELVNNEIKWKHRPVPNCQYRTIFVKGIKLKRHNMKTGGGRYYCSTVSESVIASVTFSTTLSSALNTST